MVNYRWYSQLQNDCKNVYSSAYAVAKGQLAEDLGNGEFSYPLILALNHPKGELVTRAMKSSSKRDAQKALEVIQSASVRGVCLQELNDVGSSVQEFVEVWGRKEKMDYGEKDSSGR
jgi:geranylgeranyldiphosphate transferase